MQESIGEQVAREIRMLDVAQKILKEMAKIAFKSSADVRAGDSVKAGAENGVSMGPSETRSRSWN